MNDTSSRMSRWRKLLYAGLGGCAISVIWFLLFSMSAIQETSTPGLSKNAVVYVDPLCFVQNFTSICRGGMSYLGSQASFPTYSPYLLWVSLLAIGISLVMRRREGSTGS